MMKPNPHIGKFILFEGLDGSGQTTQAQLLVKWFIEKRKQLAYYTKEPTDGPIGALIKLVLSNRLVCSANDKSSAPLNQITMALFFAADRADHLHNEIIPKLKNGIHVVTDRYYLSSLAYQSVVADYEWIKELNKYCLRPDLSIFLDVPPAICVKRMQAQRWHVELYEDLPNLEKVQQSYYEAIEKLKADGERMEIIDGNQPVKDVHRSVVQAVKRLLKATQKPKRAEHSRQLRLLMEAEPLTEKEIAAHLEG